MPDPNYGTGYAAGDVSWILSSTALVWLMIPGVGYFYSGMARSKNALSLIMCSVLSLVVVSVQWFIWGYSLTFSKSASPFIGNLDNAFLRGVLGDPSIGSKSIPDIVFMIFQCMFAALTPALAIGSAAERGRLLPMVIFMFIWSTIVYDVIACWTWNPNGWSAKLGGLDFAGGTPVHISSGFASLAYALVLGKRQGHGSLSQAHDFKPHNMSNVVLGTALLWFGWFGFNGGSALAGNLRAAMACVVTNLAAAVGAITWMCLDYRIERKFTALGFCSGAVAGLVAITPASGFVGPGPSVAIGFLGAIACNFAVHLKHMFNYDDALDVFAVHGVGGYVGSILTGIFAESYIAGLDGSTDIAGGWMNQHWVQIGYQFADATAGASWSFFITLLILLIMDRIPGLSLRVDPEMELQGLDAAEIGEMAYYHVDKIVTVDPTSGQQKVVSERVREVHQQASPNGEIDTDKTATLPSQLNNV
ncbi:ammonium transporter AmtB-like domain-containing protein [Halteromyces radiatus]|uniref:ammonium transporter AmtB-like domain-containing protein n=1 Tax=Halteromyces radiatus TaxID=101107 RepID=UPI0022206426|nr:ammonium transporter AmtB-like domain-containing protein [Halteromyces radiatus]KAI8093890.1 ammonium transporter AmtB-like domain-containing protein [Halteromyces radiatus]